MKVFWLGLVGSIIAMRNLIKSLVTSSGDAVVDLYKGIAFILSEGPKGLKGVIDDSFPTL